MFIWLNHLYLVAFKWKQEKQKKKCHSCQELLTVMSTVIFLIFCVHFFLFLHEAFLIRAINAFVDHRGEISWLSRVPACSHRAKRAIFSLWHYPPNLTHNFLNVDIGLTAVVLFKDLSFIFSHWQINIRTLLHNYTHVQNTKKYFRLASAGKVSNVLFFFL